MEKRLNIVSCRYQGDNGYTILMCDEVNEGGKAIACSLSCVGNFLPTTKNRIFVADVEEVTNKKYGKQYNVKSYDMPDPSDKAGVVDVIVSCRLKGIGKKKAEKIVDYFGADKTLNILDQDFMRISKVHGMPKNLDGPKKQWQDSRDLRQLISIIGSVNVSNSKLLKIKQTFKAQTLDIIKQTPYQVMKIKGIDFYIADSIAKNCKSYIFSINDVERIKAGIKQSLLDAMLEGHLFLRTAQVIKKAQDILMIDQATVPNNEIKLGINELLKEQELAFTTFNKQDCDFAFYLSSNYKDEVSAAKKIIKMAYSPCMKEPEKLVQDKICEHEQKDGIKLAQRQRQAVCRAINYPVSIVTGGPGRGKTTVLNTIINVYKDFYSKNEIILLAPTGRAARRMAEATNMEAYTIHSMLGLRSDDDSDEYLQDKQLAADLIIIDEMSMTDQKLFALLCAQLPDSCKLVMVGDKDQLSSVGAGNVFTELILSNTIPTTILDTPFRQGENDLIYINAEKINKGDTNLLEGITFKFIEASGEKDIRDKCLSCYQSSLAENNNELDSIFMLSPFRKRTDIGSNQLNNTLQSAVNKSIEFVDICGKRFCKGDKVMQTVNITTDEGISFSNGDIGYVTDVYAGKDNDCSVTVNFEGVGVKVYQDHDDFEMLELAYATTIHKSQGSEANTVIIVVSNIFSVMLKRNLIYTAVSRAKKKCIVIGDRNAFNKAILNTSYVQRNTLFGWRLQLEQKNYIKEDVSKGKELYSQMSFI